MSTPVAPDLTIFRPELVPTTITVLDGLEISMDRDRDPIILLLSITSGSRMTHGPCHRHHFSV